MKAFGIQDSIVRPFAKLPTLEQGQKPSYNLVQDYASKNLPCGNVNFGNLGTIMGAADMGIKAASSAIGAVLAVVDLGIQVGLEVAMLAAKCLDKVDKLIDNIKNFNLSDKLDKINLKLKDLGVGLKEAAAKAIKGLVAGIGSTIKKIGDACKKLLSAFDNNVIGDIAEDPIESLAKLLKCKTGDVLGMLATGLSGLANNSSSSFGFSNPLSGVMGTINGTIGKVNGVVGSVNGAVRDAVGSVNNAANGLLSNIPGPVKAAIGGLNPQAGRFLQQNGVGSIINTALGNNMLGNFSVKNVDACLAAQRFNRFGNYDPFISTAMSMGALDGANAQLAQALYGVMRRDDNVACNCCRNEDVYKQREKYVNLASKMFDRRDNYHQANIPVTGIAPMVRPTYNRLPDDMTARTIASYGFDEQNILSQNLGTALEGVRITGNLSGNLSESTTDFTKINDFAEQMRANMGYLGKMNERNLQENLGMKEDMLSVSKELEASELTSGYPFGDSFSPEYPIAVSYASDYNPDSEWDRLGSDDLPDWAIDTGEDE
jgi:hypothetical protein